MNANRIGLALAAGTFTLAGFVGLAGLTGCGPAADPAAGAGAGGARAADSVEVPMTLAADGQALAAIGIDPMSLQADAETATPETEVDDPASASPGPAGSPGPGQSAGAGKPGTAGASREAGNRRRPLRRIAIRRHVQHGEFVIQTKRGDQTIVVQRGTVQSVNATSLTVKSPDGFTSTWTINDRLRVIKDRTRATPAAVVVGTEIAIAGVRTDGGTTGQLVVVQAR